jgi:uncharacterized protein (DUF3084 family)
MLTRISLIVALLAALAVGVVNVVFVKDKINTIVTDRDTQRSGRMTAEGDRDKAKTELASKQKELDQSKQELADAKTEREKAVATAAAQIKKAEDLSTKLAQTTEERDKAQTDLAAYRATGVPAEQVGQLNRLLKNAKDELDIAKEEQQVLQRTVNRLQVRLARYEGTNKPVELRANLRGKIIVVDPKWDFVVLNIGINQGVIEDGELLVSREGKLVAKVVIRSVEQNRSIANIVPGWKLGEVIEGDEVTPAHPAI